MSEPGTGAETIAAPMRVGDVVVDPPLVLGPMAGTTDRVYRLLCRRAGAGLVCSEMVSINAIVQGNARTLRMLRTFGGEHPVSVQLFGSDPEIMANALPAAEEAGADVIDLNMGCAVPKVRRIGAGAALMGDHARAVALTAAAVRAARGPVTVKIRAGLVPGDDYVDLARRLQDAGAAAVAIHARTASQGFRGAADWRHIARVVDALDVPVIGNGDVTEPADAVKMMRATGCAAVMIARAACGRPWVFGQAAAALRGEPIPPAPPPAARMAIALLHAQMLVLEFGERIAMHQMRAQMHHYVRGLPDARQFRAAANDLSTLDDLRALVERYCANIQGGPAGQAVGTEGAAAGAGRGQAP